MYQNIKRYLNRERKDGVSVIRLVCFRIPRQCITRLYANLASLANDLIFNRFVNAPRFKKFQHKYQDKLHNHFYIIAMPNMLHFLNPCLKLIPPDVNIVLILNGIHEWEENYLRKHYRQYPQFKLIACPASNLSHGSVLTLLLTSNQTNFGIIDHDLYCFNKDVFNQLSFNAKECVIGAIKLTNLKSQLDFPTTHFLFFNITLIKKIMQKYHISAHIYKRIPLRLKHKLITLNLGNHNFLKAYLSYFDTFNLILAMAFYEELSARILNLTTNDMYHIGGTSHVGNNACLNYISLRFLELSHNRDLMSKYTWLVAKKGSIYKDLLKSFSQKAQLSGFIGNIDHVIRKIEQNA